MKVFITNARLSFPDLFEAVQFDGKGPFNYGCQLLIPEGDPILTKRWVVGFRYTRMPLGTERLEAVCEPDLLALKALDLPSLKDTDVEAARLLDPSLQYNAGH